MTDTDVLDGRDILDSRDIIARIDELEDELQDRALDADEMDEITKLKEVAADGAYFSDWEHGITLIRDSYWLTYAQDYAEEIGVVTTEAQWPYTCIDWERAAADLQTDYSTIEIDGVTYWTR